jgi:Domain of unknown function (DUF4373)
VAKEAYYFSHDANARNDEKVLMLRAEHGWQGYGIFWALIEMMFESSDTSLHHDKTKGIAVSYNIDITLLKDVINTCITEGLFVSDGDMFWSESLKRRKGKYQEMKEKKAEAGRKGMAKRWAKDNTVITENNKEKESKEKEIKEKESKGNKTISPKFETCDMEMAQQLFSRILENNENAKKPDLDKWANEIRLMRISDNRTEEQIRYLIDWTQSDSFWKSNILSPAKLRKQFDSLAIRVKEDIKKQNKVAQIQDRKPRAYQSLQDWADEA